MAARSEANAKARECALPLSLLTRSNLRVRRPRYEAQKRMSSRPFVKIAMDYLCGIAPRGQRATHRLCQHDGTMTPSRAPEGDRQITFALADVMGNQISQQTLEAPEEFTRLGEGSDIAGHFGIASRKLAQPGNKMRIGQKAHIENQVRVGRQTVPISEAHQGNHQRPFASALKPIDDELPQFMDIKPRRVDDDVSQFSNWRHQTALMAQDFAHRPIVTQRMGASRFAEAAQQRLVRGFDEYQTCGHLAANLFI